jgi:phage terminase large subunit-like protein
LEFFAVGATYRERCFMAGNRVGKTVAGSYEMTCHLTGNYPEWWKGRRFHGPIKAWAAGKTNETTRDIIQVELLGNITFSGQRKLVDGTGLIPKELLGQDQGQLSWKAGVADLVDMVKVKHVSGGLSELGLKSYQQGRGSFEGTARHVIWFDEEPPLDVYGEALIRTATTKGMIMLTFTPLEGMSDVVQEFLPREMRPGGGN